MTKVIQKGTKLPCKQKGIFFPSEVYQASIMVQVFEGENKYVKNNYRLGKFTLLNLANKKKGK